MNKLDNLINELKINPVERFEKPCTFNKSLIIEYLIFTYLGVEFVISASRNGYALSWKDHTRTTSFRTDKALIRELKSRFKRLKGEIVNEQES